MIARTSVVAANGRETVGAYEAQRRVVAPVFLVGAERSGSTLLRLMFDHHPRLAFFSDLFQFAINQLGTEGDESTDREALQNHWWFRALLDSGLEFHAELSWPELLDSILRQKRDRDGKAEVGAVVHYHFEGLLRVWPDARFIHLVRDGRDVGLSTIRMGWAGNMYTAVSRWIEAERQWVELSKIVPPERRLEVRYEDLVADIESSLARICGFLGLTFDPAMLGYPSDSTYEPPSTRAISKWRSALSPSEVALAESRIGPMLVERGYALSGAATSTPLPLAEAAATPLPLQLDDWWYRLNFRRKRYGTALLLGDIISRRLPIGPLRRAVRDRVERIDRSFLK